jgi:NTE family protein
MTDIGIGRLAAAILLAGMLSGCSTLESMYLPAQTVALQAPPSTDVDTACDAPTPAIAPAYYMENLKDCTAKDTLVVFAFSGGGIRSASFGYGALQAAHATAIPDGAGGHPFDRDIDAVSGVSGGSFTAAAFASQHDRLFPAAGHDYYRDNFLTHNFFVDLVKLYLSPLHWRWLFPYYGTNDEMAEIYADIDFSSPKDKLFAADFGELAKKGRPFLAVQATDYGNEQPFTLTQNDFDLICSDVNRYPVGAAIAASSAFPVLFSPIQLVNHHFTPNTEKADNFCHSHRPAWVDDVLARPEPADLSRIYARAKAASYYLPTGKRPKADSSAPQYVYLQDGGATDNVALRGLSNIMIQYIPDAETSNRKTAERLCRLKMDGLRKILIVAVDGEAQPDNSVSSLPYLSDLGLILNVTSSAMIDANGFEVMLSTDAMLKKFAERLSYLDCGNTDAAALAPREVKAYFARVSFQDLAAATDFPSPAACGKAKGESCTVDDLAHTGTSLNFSDAEVDALIRAGQSAFSCNRKIREFFADSGAPPPAGSLACAAP